MRTDVALEILGDPQSYSFETVRSAGQHVLHLIASQAAKSPVQSVDHAVRKIRELEAENERLQAEVERLQASRAFWKRVASGWQIIAKDAKARRVREGDNHE